MDSQISKKDKLIIYSRTVAKIFRGGKRLFFKQAKGLFLVGKGVQISHGKHITCGKNVKFEDFSEIHGLCSDGLVFGDYVTISRGVMIHPSSYYGNDLGKGLVMGEHSYIGPHGYVGCSGKITIGKNVMFGRNAVCLQRIITSLTRRAASKAKASTRKASRLKMTAGLAAML